MEKRKKLRTIRKKRINHHFRKAKSNKTNDRKTIPDLDTNLKSLRLSVLFVRYVQIWLDIQTEESNLVK